MNKRNYWAFRTDKKNLTYVSNELLECRLRQGWGWDNGQDLRNLTVDEGARRNLAMYNKVKKGDIVLVPRIPNYEKVTIVEATEDWNSGYYFKVDETIGDLGHVFPAKILNTFTRGNDHVSGAVRATLKNISRFWNINHCSENIEKLIQIPEEKLDKLQRSSDRFTSSIFKTYIENFNFQKFNDDLFENLKAGFSHAEWEDLLVAGFKALYPAYACNKEGGIKEKGHGTDILIRIPSLLTDYDYGIAIQVKDYVGKVDGRAAIDQINKADGYWFENENIKIIDKIVIVTKATNEDNLSNHSNLDNVRFIFSEDLKELIGKMAASILQPSYSERTFGDAGNFRIVE